ncbi:MAG: hypothetical protein KAW14_03610 [Candidatus Aegiribacteria sp.]|nr:hypothetical protein [Candidatus Aegiribacteria sp.]
MRPALLFILVLAAISFSDMGDVISTIPAPGGNPDGLTWIDGSLWITSDDDFMIYEIDPSNGNVLSSIPRHGNDYLTGLSYDGSQLISCCHPWIYFRDLPSGTATDSILGPDASCNEGLAWDGSSVWSTNWSGNFVYELDPETGVEISSYYPQNGGVGYEGLTGLAWDGFYLWVTDQSSDMIFANIPGDPYPWKMFPAPCGVVQDLAWDGQYLWTTDYTPDSPMVYQIDPGPPLALTPATWGSIKTEF